MTWRATVVLALLAATAAVGGEPVLELLPAPAKHLRAGEAATIEVRVVIAAGFHVQANPAANEFLVPLDLRVPETPELRPGSPEYPPPVLHRLEGSDLELTTYEKAATVNLPVAVSSTATPGAISLRGDLRFQACDARRCLPPSTIPVTLKVFIEE